MELTDLEIFMKSIDDMYNSSRGYGTSDMEIEGYLGMSLEKEDGSGSGVCRHMAENIARKLDAVYEKYNARVFVVHANGTGNNKAIKPTHLNDGKSEQISKYGDILFYNIIYAIREESSEDILGNHVVVAVDVKEDNITLIIDPTACAIGVFKDGKIIMLNSLETENPYGMYRTPLKDLAYRGVGALQIPKEYIKSFLNPSMSIEEINEKYGVEAQKEALESARKKEENYIYKQINQNNFKNNLKVDIEESKIYTVEEIEELYRQCNTMMYAENCDNEKLIRVANIIRKINNSMKYYDEKQEEIIGKDIKDSEKISTRISKPHKYYNVENNLIDLMIQNEIINLPQTDNLALKMGICSACLESGQTEELQDFKIAYKAEDETCYILDNNTVFATLRPNEDDGITYITENSITEEELDELLEIAQPVVKQEQQTKMQDENNNNIEER